MVYPQSPNLGSEAHPYTNKQPFAILPLPRASRLAQKLRQLGDVGRDPARDALQHYEIFT
jgi:hypothetical protein